MSEFIDKRVIVGVSFKIAEFFNLKVPLPDFFKSSMFLSQSIKGGESESIGFISSKGDSLALAFRFSGGDIIYSDKRGWTEVWEEGKNFFLFQIRESNKNVPSGAVTLALSDGKLIRTTQKQLSDFILTGDMQILSNSREVNYPIDRMLIEGKSK